MYPDECTGKFLLSSPSREIMKRLAERSPGKALSTKRVKGTLKSTVTVAFTCKLQDMDRYARDMCCTSVALDSIGSPVQVG